MDNTIVETLLLSPIMFFRLVLLGVISFVSPFTQFYLAICLVIFLIIHILPERFRFQAKFAFFLSMLLLWLSLLFSFNQLPISDDNYRVFATGGFPLKAFDYPVPPMGGDVPLTSMWFPFYFNFLFWFAISYISSFFLPKKLKDASLVIPLLSIIGAMVSLLGLGYTMLRFD